MRCAECTRLPQAGWGSRQQPAEGVDAKLRLAGWCQPGWGAPREGLGYLLRAGGDWAVAGR